MRSHVMLALALVVSCAPPPPAPAAPIVVDESADKRDIGAALDDMNDAAARADEERYFAHFADASVFLGTDATERWDKPAFRKFAHPFFAKGKAWDFHAVRRDITIAKQLAYFDEDLDTKNMGAARGSGVLEKIDGKWLVVQYNLALTIPNDRMKAVKLAIERDAKADLPAASTGGIIHGTVTLKGKAPAMKVPKKRAIAEFCKETAVRYDAVVVDGDGHMKDVLVRIAAHSFQGTPRRGPPVVLSYEECMLRPRVQGAVAGGELEIVNLDQTLHNIHSYKQVESWFNQALPKAVPPLVKQLPDEEGVLRFSCDVHPWERDFIVVTDHPYFAVTSAAGQYAIEGVPAGHYTIEAWHPRYGWKKAEVDAGAKPAKVDFDYKGSEPEPAENKDELRDLF